MDFDPDHMNFSDQGFLQISDIQNHPQNFNQENTIEKSKNGIE